MQYVSQDCSFVKRRAIAGSQYRCFAARSIQIDQNDTTKQCVNALLVRCKRTVWRQICDLVRLRHGSAQACHEDRMAEYASFLEPDETAYDLFARVVDDPTRTGISFLDQAIFLRPGHVVELVGPSGCGKSELLIQVQQHCIFTLVRLAVEWIKHMQAAASCILPKEVNGVLYGGREGTWLRCSTAKIAVKGIVDLLTIFSFVIQKTASC